MSQMLKASTDSKVTMQIHRKEKKKIYQRFIKYEDSIFDSAKSFSLKTLEAKSILWEE